MSKVRVGINGFGRIGRILCRAGFDELEIVGINDLDSAKASAHLLKYDSTHGKFGDKVIAGDNYIEIDGKKVNYSSCRNPEEIPWKEWGVDIVLECTGVFKKKEDIQKHFKGGAKKVIVSAPAPGADATLVFGVNHETYDASKHDIVSNASCTTNCLAPLAKTLHEAFGISHGMMTTIHSYTNDQRILDSGHRDLRRARAAALSMIPTTTGAAKAVGMVVPELAGKIDGMAVRVPTPNVSLVDFVAVTEKKVTVESVHEALNKAANGHLKNVLRTESLPLVSTDYIGEKHSSVVDTMSTMVMNDNTVKLLSWYDNEMGFSSRLVDLAKYVASKGL